MSTELPEASNSVNVFLIEDERIHREYMTRLLETIPEYKLVATANDSHQALLYMKTHEFDLVITDYKLGRRDLLWGNQLAEKVLEKCPKTKILFWSAYFSPIDLEVAKTVGAHGYVSKSAPDHILLEAMATIMQGGEWWTAPDPDYDLKILTPMQTKIVKLFVNNPRENTNQQLAQHLLRCEYNDKIEAYGQIETEKKFGTFDEYLDREFKSAENRIETHIGAIFKRLELRNRTELMVWALPIYGYLKYRKGQSKFSDMEEVVFAKFIETRSTKKTADAFYNLTVYNIKKILKTLGFEDPDKEIIVLQSYVEFQQCLEERLTTDECIKKMADSLQLDESLIRSILARFGFI